MGIKTFSQSLLTAAAVSLLVACGGETAVAEVDEAQKNATAQEAPAEAGELVVYSARKEHLIKPLFDRYTAETGVEIKYITDKAAPLLTRLQAEGENTPADLLITVDAGNLWYAADQGVLSPVESEILEANIPSYLQDPENRWFGISKRARVIVYSPERVSPEELTTYEALADPQWEGRLCLRTAKKVYNQSLVATLIEANGEDKTEEVVEGWVQNLAAPPFSNDTQTMQAVIAGQCDVAIVNTYYFGRLEKAALDKGETLPLKIFFSNQDDRGIHVNVSGVGVTANAKNREQAVKFVEWLSDGEAQNMLADLNQEFPVNPTIEASEEVKSWGSFKEDDVDITIAGQRQAEAVILMDKAGYR